MAVYPTLETLDYPMLIGEYIAFLDSDDYIEPTMYEKMYYTAKEKDADMVECDFYWEYPNKTRKDVRQNI